MPRFRGAKYLSCFYCGKRSNLRFDGSFSSFDCSYCDATNYLDQKGEITDPPVATDREATAVQYAAPKSPSSSASQKNEIFCQTCIKNQHLFTKSLAQYLPDDPSDPDYPELERNYYRYRRNLEKRYPQVCSDCAHRVEERIRQAGYTAKTDHLRRMVSLGRGRKTRRRTTLDWVHLFGLTMWQAGFILQMIWHCQMIIRTIPQSDSGMYDPEAGMSAAKTLHWLQQGASSLPAASALLQWSIYTGILAAWWNPHFIQVNRGFTRHLLGLTQWYSLQGLTIFFRFIFRKLSVDVQATSDSATLAANIATTMVAALMYVLAGRSIRVDTTPLFATSTKRLVSRQAQTPQQRKLEDSKTFSELFNDALDSATTTPNQSLAINTASSSPSPSNPLQTLNMRPSASLTPTMLEPPAPDSEAMDWSPSTPQKPVTSQNQHARMFTPSEPRHLASATRTISHPTSSPFRPLQLHQNQFLQQGQQARQSMSTSFDQTPKLQGWSASGSHQSPQMTEQFHAQQENPFWYKVPAAPVEPARRLRNPMVSPKPDQDPEDTGRILFRRKGDLFETSERSTSNSSDGVEFKQPKFFAPQRDQDASSLADMLGQSFSLGQDEDVTDEVMATGEQGEEESNTDRSGPSAAASRLSNFPELIILAIVQATWLLSIYVPLSFDWEARLITLFLAGIVAFRSTGQVGRVSLGDDQEPSGIHIIKAFGAAELAAICWIGSVVWSNQSERVEWYGIGTLACMLFRRALI